ncbi:hypothetical protein N7492_003164 [Penicillium capsulatum]|uniref:Uncharacterized protein n=1 Tax=Penicillium capsulatum TaxID=69766 RepID=A0A9W9IJ43_9EURO|nr:hypothetical protein N7492_003164 [Penicillium capsulatum]
MVSVKSPIRRASLDSDTIRSKLPLPHHVSYSTQITLFVAAVLDSRKGTNFVVLLATTFRFNRAV